MEQILIVQGLTVEQFLARIEAIIYSRMSEKLEALQVPKSTKYMTRMETARYLHVSLPTLNGWSKLGFLKPYKIGNRVLYKANEVEENLETGKSLSKMRK